MLKGSEECVQLRQRFVVRRFQLIYSRDLLSKRFLFFHRPQRNQKALDLIKMQVGNTNSLDSSIRLILDRRVAMAALRKYGSINSFRGLIRHTLTYSENSRSVSTSPRLF